MKNISKNTEAFTFIELAVVLIIIAILVAGSLSGGRLLQKAKLQATIRQFQTIDNAINSFKERFSSLPGDFSSAHKYFDDGTNSVCGTKTDCNGNGDRKIDLKGSKDSEVFRSWQHLQLSDVLIGDFSGIWNDKRSSFVSKIGANFSLLYEDNLARNIIKLGDYHHYKRPSDQGVFLPEKASSIDEKIDDGNPNKGNIRGLEGYQNSELTYYADKNKCIKNNEYNFQEKNHTSCVLGFVIK